MFQLYRMPFSIFYFCLTYFYLIASVVIRRVYRKRMGRIRFVPVWMFLMPIICCTTAQLLSYGISLAWCSVSIWLVSMHMSLQNELAYLDPLTKLFNRNYLNHILKQFSYLHTEVYGIMLDMDHFKSINDTYGHDEGDAALMEAANILFSALTVLFSLGTSKLSAHLSTEQFLKDMDNRMYEQKKCVTHRKPSPHYTGQKAGLPAFRRQTCFSFC